MRHKTKIFWLIITTIYLISILIVYPDLMYFLKLKEGSYEAGTGFLNFYKNLPANSLGDFLAGSFTPVALLWLILGYFLQAQELGQAVKSQQELTKQQATQSRLMLYQHSEKGLITMLRAISRDRQSPFKSIQDIFLDDEFLSEFRNLITGLLNKQSNNINFKIKMEGFTWERFQKYDSRLENIYVQLGTENHHIMNDIFDEIYNRDWVITLIDKDGKVLGIKHA